MQDIRVGFVGAGQNTIDKHIPNLQAIRRIELIGVCNRTEDSSRLVSRQFSIPKMYANWQEAVADPDTDAIVIGTWPNMHCCVTLAALDAGKHVLTEARMAMNAAEARQMLRASQKKPDLIAQVVPSPITLGVDSTVQRLLREGYIGNPLAIDVHYASSFLNREGKRHWRQDSDRSGMNILALGIYYEAIQRWVGEATSVMAAGKTFMKMRSDDNGVLQSVRIPEHLDVVADMACGAQLHLQQSVITAFLQGGGIYLFGEEGTLRFYQDKLWGARRGESQLMEIPIPHEEKGEWRVEEEFIGAIRGLEPVTRTTFEDGVKYMEFTEAVNRSMATGTRIHLPLSD